MTLQKVAARVNRFAEDEELLARTTMGIFLAALAFQSARDAVGFLLG
jgi:hypothetical protein